MRRKTIYHIYQGKKDINEQVKVFDPKKSKSF